MNDKDFKFFGLHEIIRRLGGRRKIFGRGRGRGRGRGGYRGGKRFGYGVFDYGFSYGGSEQFGCPPPAFF